VTGIFPVSWPGLNKGKKSILKNTWLSKQKKRGKEQKRKNGGLNWLMQLSLIRPKPGH
jgi:hypothetical protein